MCLSNPAQIIEINDQTAVVLDLKKEKKTINISAVPDAKVNDWVLTTSGFAVEKITIEDANDILKLLKKETKQ